MRKALRIVLIFSLLLAVVAAGRSGMEVPPCGGQIDEGVMRDYLLEHPEFYSTIVSEFLSENNTFIYDYLSSNPTVISNFIHSNPTIVHDYLSENPTVIYDYTSANPQIVSDLLSENLELVTQHVIEHPELVTQFISENPVIASEYVSEHPEVITRLLSANPQIISEYTSAHPDIIKSLVFSYATEHWQEVLDLAFDLILSQTPMLLGLIGVVLIFPLTCFILGWLIARRIHQKKL